MNKQTLVMNYLLSLTAEQFRDFFKAIELLRKHEKPESKREVPTQVPAGR